VATWFDITDASFWQARALAIVGPGEGGIESLSLCASCPDCPGSPAYLKDTLGSYSGVGIARNEHGAWVPSGRTGGPFNDPSFGFLRYAGEEPVGLAGLRVRVTGYDPENIPTDVFLREVADAYFTGDPCIPNCRNYHGVKVAVLSVDDDGALVLQLTESDTYDVQCITGCDCSTEVIDDPLCSGVFADLVRHLMRWLSAATYLPNGDGCLPRITSDSRRDLSITKIEVLADSIPNHLVPFWTDFITSEETL